jgi:adenine-specific DNA-methyltransferase
MEVPAKKPLSGRYKVVTEQKAGGATYTPKSLADFVAGQMLLAARAVPRRSIRVLDPAVGDGELLMSLLEQLDRAGVGPVAVHGFETDVRALNIATARIRQRFPNVDVHLSSGNFLEFALEQGRPHEQRSSSRTSPVSYDLIIANPPYVRTQIMGAAQAQQLATQFGLAGRVDLYHAFIIAMADVLKPGGIGGIIVSNRFMTTRSGSAVRQAIRQHFSVRQVWDLGDTKLFDAAVLPALLVVERQGAGQSVPAGFTSIYSSKDKPEHKATDAIAALSYDGVVEIEDTRCFKVTRGTLDAGAAVDAVWRMATIASDDWLATVEANTWKRFGDIGKIRVGVKTCADELFIRCDWDDMPASECPELLRPLTTHHCARRFRAAAAKKNRKILYPHETVDGTRQAVRLAAYPKAHAYLERHRRKLEARTYLIEAGRQWYEIWVPQDPSSWHAPKLVFRDIAEEPTFWLDQEGTIVNGDCYWLTTAPENVDLLWLAAAVANSSFIETFYDHRFNNKLYAGRRRFITQYVERFPLPDPALPLSRRIVLLAKEIYDTAGTDQAERLSRQLDQLVCQIFGVLPVEKPGQ